MCRVQSESKTQTNGQMSDGNICMELWKNYEIVNKDLDTNLKIVEGIYASWKKKKIKMFKSVK